MLDGIDNNSDTVDFLNGTNYVVLPPVEAIQEFKVQTRLQRRVWPIRRRSTQRYDQVRHQQLPRRRMEYFRNDEFDAADWFENVRNTQKGELRLNQFARRCGGPMIKNKIFIFGDYEGLRRIQGTIIAEPSPRLSRGTGSGPGCDPTLADFRK